MQITFLRRPLILLIIFLMCVATLGYFLYKKHESQKHVSLVAMGEGPYPVAVLGDSLAMGVGASSYEKNFANQILLHIQTKEPGAQVFNLGLSGARISDVRDGQIDQVHSLNPKIIFLIIGTNDVIRGTAEDSFRDDYNAVVNTLLKENVPVVICNIPDFASTPIVPSALNHLADHETEVFNGIIEEVSQKSALLRLYDFYGASKPLLTNSALISGDGFHPNDAGYAVMANGVWDFIQ